MDHIYYVAHLVNVRIDRLVDDIATKDANMNLIFESNLIALSISLVSIDCRNIVIMTFWKLGC